MKNPILLPLISCSVLLGCHDSTPPDHTPHTQIDTTLQQNIIPAAWVGTYQGNTPCMTCISHCEACPGMAVELILHADQSYQLKRQRLTGQDQLEEWTGHFRFKNNQQTQIELIQVKARNLIYLDMVQQVLEILEDKSGNLYEDQEAFLLEKSG